MRALERTLERRSYALSLVWLGTFSCQDDLTSVYCKHIYWRLGRLWSCLDTTCGNIYHLKQDAFWLGMI